MTNEGTHQRPESALCRRWADQLQHQLGVIVYDRSFVMADGVICFLSRGKDGLRYLWLAWDQNPASWVEYFQGTGERINLDGDIFSAKRCPADGANAAVLRQQFSFTRPQFVGLQKSFGFGDRLGLATPGHVLSLADRSIAPVLAQQSMREMARTRRTPQQVMDDVSWSVFQMGFEKPFGTDADHLKTTEDIDACAKAGFLLFTIDPGDHVDDQAGADDIESIDRKFDHLPWSLLQTTAQEMLNRYPEQVSLENCTLPFTRPIVLRSAVKYGRAVAHIFQMYQHLLSTLGPGNFELEISVDETASTTTPQEHFFVATELRRLEVRWTAIAPRFVGDFEKGVDYIGDLGDFKHDFSLHAQVARHLGPYKLSIHSGSDKFSIYPIASKFAGDLIHVKTAGTSYLEALRVLAKLEPDLFRRILDFARDRYPEDRASYHVSADPSKVPPAGELSDYRLSILLDDFQAREILHVTFGSVLTATDDAGQPYLKKQILDALIEHEEAYHQCLCQHFAKHLDPFTR